MALGPQARRDWHRNSVGMGFNGIDPRENRAIVLPMPVSWSAVVRDSLFLFALTYLGGFLSEIFTGIWDGHTDDDAIAGGVNLLIGSLGFFLIGLWSHARGWGHLGAVCWFAWVWGLLQIAFGLPFWAWLITLPYLLLMMGIGGGLARGLRLATPWILRRFGKRDALR